KLSLPSLSYLKWNGTPDVRDVVVNGDLNVVRAYSGLLIFHPKRDNASIRLGYHPKLGVCELRSGKCFVPLNDDRRHRQGRCAQHHRCLRRRETRPGVRNIRKSARLPDARATKPGEGHSAKSNCPTLAGHRAGAVEGEAAQNRGGDAQSPSKD